MAITDTGNYLSEFADNIVDYLNSNIDDIKFEGKKPNIKHDFPLDGDTPPAIRVVCLDLSDRVREYNKEYYQLRAQVHFYCSAAKDVASKVETWANKIRKVLTGRGDGTSKNYWQTEVGGQEYMLDAWVEDITIYDIRSRQNYMHIDGVINLIGKKEIV